MAENTPPASMPPFQIDKNIAKLARAVESTYGNGWDIVWRNFLAGFTRVLGMAAAYVVLVAIIALIIFKTGALGQIQTFWKNLTQSLVGDIQKNFQQSLPQIQIPSNQTQLNQPPPIDPNDLPPPQNPIK